MRFERPKGSRLHKQFYGVKVDGYWWFEDFRMWVPDRFGGDVFDRTGATASNYARCHSIKAFKRMLRKHPCIIGRATLRSKFIGYDVYA